ncbi:11664_t:CDS:2, partial [Gigaspora rosea]
SNDCLPEVKVKQSNTQYPRSTIASPASTSSSARKTPARERKKTAKRNSKRPGKYPRELSTTTSNARGGLFHEQAYFQFNDRKTIKRIKEQVFGHRAMNFPKYLNAEDRTLARWKKDELSKEIVSPFIFGKYLTLSSTINEDDNNDKINEIKLEDLNKIKEI